MNNMIQYNGRKYYINNDISQKLMQKTDLSEIGISVIFGEYKISDDIFVGDYWGYPFAWRPDYAGGGGASIRNVKKLLDLCIKYRPDTTHFFYEDSWICEKLLEMNSEIPSFDFRRNYIMENTPSVNPYIVHQFWTFVDFFKDVLDTDIFKKYWDWILTFEDC
jgi:hypothetical protein